jgi:hypothetical protein
MPLEILVGAAVGAAAASSTVRKTVRQGLVYGLAGALIAYDKVTAAAQGAVQGARHAATAGTGTNAKESSEPSKSAPGQQNGPGSSEHITTAG